MTSLPLLSLFCFGFEGTTPPDRLRPLLEAGLGESHPDTLTVLENYAAFLRQVGRAKEAVPLEERVRAIRSEP